MNILYTTFEFNVGGIEKLLVDTCNFLSKDENNKIYLCIINNSFSESLISQIDKRVKILFLNRQIGGKRIKYSIKYAKLVSKYKIDIIHCQMENAVKFSILAKIMRPKVKIFTTVHDTRIFTNLKYSEVLMDKIMCNKIIAISDVVKDEILSRGVSEDKVIRIYNAIDIQKFKNSSKKEKNNKIVIGNVSRLTPMKKGQDVLIKAISKVKEDYPDILCLLAGQSPADEPNNLKDLKQLCHSLKVDENVKFLGNVNDVPGFLDKIDIFILPSRFEGFGISLIEAMSKGIPCIASNIDGPKEIIKDNQYGLLFQSGNDKDLAEKIEYRIKNINFDKEHIKEYVNSNFEINSMKNKLINLYEN